MTHDYTYLDLLKHVLENGRLREDRTGTGTIGIFGAQLRFPLAHTFPLLTSKKVHWPAIVHELIWFLKGDTNIKYLNDNGVKIWNEWADDNGDLGPVYGAMWRSWPAGDHVIDQIANVINDLRNNPFSRRHIVSGWNPTVLPDTSVSPRENAANGLQALPPCHTMFQFFVQELTYGERLALSSKYGLDWGNHTRLVNDEVEAHEMKLMDDAGVPRLGLSCQLYQRSADMFLGVPFNIASYALLTHMIAKVTGMSAREFIWTAGDAHIYTNHVDQVKEQIGRSENTPGVRLPKSPTLEIEGEFSRVEDIGFDDIKLIGYNPLPAIKAPISV